MKYKNVTDVLNSGNVHVYDEGILALENKGVELFEYFDKKFKSFALEAGAVEENYPVLLPLMTLKDTGYMKTSPQHPIFINAIQEDMDVLDKSRNIELVDDCLDTAVGALSPSACFHVYERYRNSVLEKEKAITLLQNVFRNESKSSWGGFGRLRDYHVREIVFVGSQDYVDKSRNFMIERTKEFIKELGIKGDIECAADPFVLPQMQRYKLIQFHNKAKYEAVINYSEEKQLAAASFNIHGRTFAKPFNIKVDGVDTVTGCVGYGIERWVLAYMCQYGDRVPEK